MMAIAPDSAYQDMLNQKKAAPARKAPVVPVSGAAQAEKNTYLPSAAQVDTLDSTDLPEGVVPGYGAGTPMTVYNQASNLEEPSYGIQTSEETGKQFAGGKSISNRITNADGSVTIIYSDGTSEVISGAKSSTLAKQDTSTADAYQRLYDEFSALGLGALVSDAKDLLMKSTSISAMPDALRNTKAYKQRFSANDARIAAGLSALSPADYLDKEDKYQSLMRNYGLPASYYAVGQYGKQEGFDKLLANDVSAVELEDRILTAQQRVLNANPEVLNAIKNFYGDSITNGDILAYTLDPTKGLADIKKKVTAAEIQGAANVFGLNKITAESTPEQIKSLEARANALAGYGINKATAQQGFAQVAEITPVASQLADIYKQTPYTQQTAESEVFGTSGAAAAKEQRKKLKSLEEASFAGSSGVGALGRDKSAYGLTQGQTGLY